MGQTLEFYDESDSKGKVVSENNPLPVVPFENYTILDQKTITIVALTANHLVAVAGTKQIRIRPNADVTGGNRLYMGKSGVTALNGYPIYDFTTGPINTRECILNTTTPEDIYLILNSGSLDIRVLYLG